MSTILTLARAAILGVLGAGLILASSPAKGEAENHNSSRSNVATLAGDPVPGVEIALTQIPGGRAFTGVTGADGRVEFQNVPAGSYQVVFRPHRGEVKPGISVTVDGNVTVRGWDPKAKQSSGGGGECLPAAIGEEGMDRKAGKEQAGADPAKRVAVKEEGLPAARKSGSIIVLDRLAEGPMCAALDVSGEGLTNLGITINTTKLNTF